MRSLKYEGPYARTSCSDKLGPRMPHAPHTQNPEKQQQQREKEQLAAKWKGRAVPKSSSIFISGLPEDIVQWDLQNSFRKYGDVQQVFFNKAQNYAVVDMAEVPSATSIVTLANGDFVVPVSKRQNDRATLKVAYSTQKASQLQQQSPNNRMFDLRGRLLKQPKSARERPSTAPQGRAQQGRNSIGLGQSSYYNRQFLERQLPPPDLKRVGADTTGIAAWLAIPASRPNSSNRGSRSHSARSSQAYTTPEPEGFVVPFQDAHCKESRQDVETAPIVPHPPPPPPLPQSFELEPISESYEACDAWETGCLDR